MLERADTQETIGLNRSRVRSARPAWGDRCGTIQCSWLALAADRRIANKASQPSITLTRLALHENQSGTTTLRTAALLTPRPGESRRAQQPRLEGGHQSQHRGAPVRFPCASIALRG